MNMDTSINEVLCDCTDIITLIQSKKATSDGIRFSNVEFPADGKL